MHNNKNSLKKTFNEFLTHCLQANADAKLQVNETWIYCDIKNIFFIYFFIYFFI